MLTPMVNYLGPAHPQRESPLPAVPPGQHASPEPEGEAADAPSRQSRRTLLNLKLVVPLTTIAMFALPTATALATAKIHF
jgi:hypothetical protein